MGHIFISYSRNDVVYVQKLVDALERQGFNPWIDVDELRAGTRWQERLHKQIESCDAYLLILSPNSRKSKWVEDELTLAKNLDKPIFPLLLEETKLYLGIQTVQYEDVRGGRLPSKEFYDRLAKKTPRIKKQRRKKTVPSPEEQERNKKVDQAAEKASFFLAKFANGVKDAVAVVAKVGAGVIDAAASKKVLKKKSTRIRRKPKPARERTAGKKTTAKKKK